MHNIILDETTPRGFFSLYMSLLSSATWYNSNENVDYGNIFADTNYFSLYGDPANWLNPHAISSGDGQTVSSLDHAIWDNYPQSQLNMPQALERFAWNDRVQLGLQQKVHIPAYTLGIHLRGTDHNNQWQEGPRKNLVDYLPVVREKLHLGIYKCVFVCSDEIELAQGMISWLQNIHGCQLPIICYDHERLPPGSDQGLHSQQVSNDKRLIADQVITDAHALSQCHTIIGKFSNLMYYAKCANNKVRLIYLDKYTGPPTIQIFIFNWPGQTSKALETQASLTSAGYKVTVINSDPDYTPFNWINLGNSAYFGQQWSLAMGLFNADIMFHIQADATYDNWDNLIKDALRYHEKYQWGIYSPRFQDNGWYVPLDTWHCEDENIRAVPNPDCTCWFLDRTVIDRFKQLNLNIVANHYGWGIDCVLCALSWMSGKLVLRDFAHEVYHHPGRGYSSQEATEFMNRMFESLNGEINQAIAKQYGDRESLLQYLS